METYPTGSNGGGVAEATEAVHSDEQSDVFLKDTKSKSNLSIFRHGDFRYRKSIYATLFAVFFIASILFLMLYLRCYDSYVQLAEQKEIFELRYQGCIGCSSSRSYCSNQTGEYRCHCKRGYFDDNGVCQYTSFSMKLGNKTHNLPIKDEEKDKQTSILSVCFWIRAEKGSSDSTLQILQSKDTDFSLSVDGAGNLQVKFPSFRTPRVVDLRSPLNRWTHLCVSMRRLLSVYVNGKSHRSMTIDVLGMTSIESLLHFGQRNKGTYNWDISDYYLLRQELQGRDVLNFFPSNTGIHPYEYLVTWNDVVSYAQNNSIPLRKFLL
eukprot:TCONS_00061901-protein